ncbi:MAG: hypothetical protein ACP5VE_05980 [Chthonomonadales bacterium]
MRPPWFRWVVGIAAGVALAAALTLYLYPRHYSADVQLLRKLGYDPPVLFATQDLERKAWRTGHLAPDEFTRLKALTQDPNMFIRARAFASFVLRPGDPARSVPSARRRTAAAR